MVPFLKVTEKLSWRDDAAKNNFFDGGAIKGRGSKGTVALSLKQNKIAASHPLFVQ